MADQSADQTTQQEAQQPSFKEAVAQTRQAEEQRLNDLLDKAGVKRADDAAATAEATAPEAPRQTGVSDSQQQAIEDLAKDLTPEEYAAWLEKQPKGAIKQAAMNIGKFYDQKMREQFGDLLQLGELAQNDPVLRKKLERLVKDPEAKKFILDQAFEIFDPVEYKSAPAPAGIDTALTSREEIAKTVHETLQFERQVAAYQADRELEVAALVNKFPSLNWNVGDAAQQEATYKKVQHVIETAEARSKKFNQRVSYHDIVRELGMAEEAQRTAPHAVPQTSQSSVVPVTEQEAPRNAMESKTRMKQLLDTHGSLTALAASIPQSRRA